uniref:Uncharacterized protein n=1 Tax=Anguilla anguilla TaxID=7936 RepID=A0A0E9U220_ANGAN
MSSFLLHLLYVYPPITGEITTVEICY